MFWRGGKRVRHLPSLVLDEESPFSRFYHQLSSTRYPTEMKWDAFCPTKLQVRRQGVAPKRPDEDVVGANFFFVFQFSAAAASLFPSAEFSVWHTLLSEILRFLIIFSHFLSLYLTNLYEALNCFVHARINSN